MSDPTTESEKRRLYHRIRYPLPERPKFQCADQICAVLDISARGLRYAIVGDALPNPHDLIKGILCCRRSAPVNIEGTVMRVQNGTIALYLHQEIPFTVLVAEQRYLHQRYPMW
ncbi:MAG: PilZ domain-containing protein [Candidatus Contendobacter sp.]|nr:PilZ domain-containing protein [Candidatus Contendobacter sp.]